MTAGASKTAVSRRSHHIFKTDLRCVRLRRGYARPPPHTAQGAPHNPPLNPGKGGPSSTPIWGPVCAPFDSSSGRSTGPHLHFEYWIDGRAVDPLSYFEPHQAGEPQRRVRGQRARQHLSTYARSRCHQLTSGAQGQNEIMLGADVAPGTAKQPGCPD